MLPRDLAEPVGGGPGHLDGLLGEARESRLGARVGPAGEVLRPDRGRVRGQVGLREDDELRPVRRGLGRALGQALDRGFAVEDDGLDLGAGDGDGAAHWQGSTEKARTLREFA